MIADIYIETSIKWNQVKDGVVGIAISIEQPEDAKSFFGRVTKASETAAVLLGLKNALGYLDKAEVIRLNISCPQVAAAFSKGWLDKWAACDFKKPIKNADIWRCVYELLNGRAVVVRLNEFNGFRRWLTAECIRREEKYG